MERNRRHQKPNMTFNEYCALIEQVLKLMDRKVEARPLLQPKNFKL